MSTKAFSILEMSISISIIALLVAAVTAGQSIKHKLELKQIVDDMSTIQKAVTDFESGYSSLPGDLYNASTALGSSASNGNGDGNLDTGSPNEELLFWQHLSLAGLIDGNYDGTTNGPGGRMEGGIKRSIYNASTTVSVGSGTDLLNIRVSQYVNGVENSIFTPKEMYDYDFKYDDGVPNTGSIRADEGADVAANTCWDAVSTNSYVLSQTGVTCMAYFFIETQ